MSDKVKSYKHNRKESGSVGIILSYLIFSYLIHNGSTKLDINYNSADHIKISKKRQTRKTLPVLNSNYNYIQPLRANLTTMTNNMNAKPGQTNICPTKKARRIIKGKRRFQYNQITSTSKFDQKLKSTPTKTKSYHANNISQIDRAQIKLGIQIHVTSF